VFVRFVLFIFLGSAAITLVMLALRIMFSAKSDYQTNFEHSSSFRDVLRGKVRTTYDGSRDFTVKAGLAIDTNTNEWIEQGALSDEAIDTILGNKLYKQG